VHLGVIGGSGFYSFLDDVEEVEVDTPWGRPSAPVAVGELAGHRLAFLPRHGARHELPPHRVNYRANVWALRELGVERIFGPCAAGSLQASMAPGHVVVCDQLVDRTWGREGTFFDGPQVNHVSFAEPYCPELREVALDAARRGGVEAHDGGTVVVVQGPRFSTRAESSWFSAQGWHLVNMTQHPEAYLARELGICYATLALVTDYDAGLGGFPGVEPVSHDVVLQVFEENLHHLRRVLFDAVAAVPEERACSCAGAPNGLVPGAPTP
jgi:5'-methylthioadenosine phosphorylase